MLFYCANEICPEACMYCAQGVWLSTNFKLRTDPATLDVWKARNKEDGFRLAFAGREIESLCRTTAETFGRGVYDARRAEDTPLAAWHSARRKIVKVLAATDSRRACLGLRNAFKTIRKYLPVLQEEAERAAAAAEGMVCSAESAKGEVWTCAISQKPAPSQLGMVWEEVDARDAAAEAHLLVRGKVWRGVTGDPPAHGARIDCPGLAAVIRDKRHRLTHAEWRDFGLAALPAEAYVVARAGVYHVPVDYAALAGQLRTRMRFSQDECHAMGIANLEPTDIVEAGGRYFRPLPTAMLFIDGGIYARPALRAYVAAHGQTPTFFACTVADVDDPVFSAPSLQSLVCCITCSVTHNPIVAKDGKVYDREKLLEWINRGKSVCPLNPNVALSLADVKGASCPLALLEELHARVQVKLQACLE